MDDFFGILFVSAIVCWLIGSGPYTVWQNSNIDELKYEYTYNQAMLYRDYGYRDECLLVISDYNAKRLWTDQHINVALCDQEGFIVPNYNERENLYER